MRNKLACVMSEIWATWQSRVLDLFATHY